jgi:hypothetical protein
MSYPGKLTLVSYTRADPARPARGDGLGQVGPSRGRGAGDLRLERVLLPGNLDLSRQQEVSR